MKFRIGTWKIGTRKTITAFLWFPKAMPISPIPGEDWEIRWLIKATWEEMYVGRGMWQSQYWIDKTEPQ